MRHLVFVYGTLRNKEDNHHYLKDATMVSSECWTYGKLYDVGCGYPAMINDNHNKVYGELYEVNDKELNQLNELEGYEENNPESNLYDRVVKEIYTEGVTYQAFTYIFTAEQISELLEIKSGDWSSHIKSFRI
ncbi:gamma-glutamylcyclotransferase family protein [Aquibacillus rhizosphaerae]|uniref:Gamma-glutamylcyclotransferase family protein n=1 Tax=Aquibacillus rhizosphaerae TaxID=3051431 RepID=A0ABT7L8V1_9BACI|nr:gamma-glutamylcyclotransferase family protein [Aquibacillus sp. LR5S19]MDL4842281.1 gamma-glutamylcyclotransferase family protein [Aquibacillus sp. LR5S19]